MALLEIGRLIKAATIVAVIPAQAGIQYVGLIAFRNNQLDYLDCRVNGFRDAAPREEGWT